MKYLAMQTPTWHRPSWLVILGVGLLTGTFVGCGKEGLERAIVGGTVTYQGQPLKEGEIRLVPRDGAKLPSSAGYIVDGAYTLDAKGGVPVGTYTIQIEAYRVLPETATQKSPPSNQDIPPSRKQFIPRKYNVDSQLELAIPPGSGRVTKDLQLTD